MSPSIVSPLFVLIRSSGAHSSSMKVSRIIHPSAGVSFLSTSFGKYPAPGIGPGHNVVQGLPLVLQVAAINARAVPVLRANDDDLASGFFDITSNVPLTAFAASTSFTSPLPTPPARSKQSGFAYKLP